MTVHSHPAQISIEVLEWAMSRVSVNVEELALACSTSSTVVYTWLSGSKKPSFRQAQLVAKRLRIPFGFLFLASPPPDLLSIPDFRRVNREDIETISPDLHDVVLDVLHKQSWLSEFLRESGAQPVRYVAQRSGSNSVVDIAGDIRVALKLVNNYRRPSNGDAFLRDMVQRVEALHINVLRSGIVGQNTHRPLDVSEFRGFCLSDEFAPFIFINSADAKVAQVFTLLHELAHIWRGDSGVSGGPSQSFSSIETLCNRVAAEALVSSGEFDEVWNGDLPLPEAIDVASKHFQISRYVIAIKAFESQRISRYDLDELLDEYAREGRRVTPSKGGDYYRTLIVRNGRSFTERVIGAVGRQDVLIREAASLLDTKPGHLESIKRELRRVG